MENKDEKVIAVVEPTMENGESNLEVQVLQIGEKANELIVADDEQYKEAGELGVMLRDKICEVTDFFAPMKKAAHEAHKQVCDREKKMLAPLKDAESRLKRAMSDYAYQKETERRRLEEEARKAAAEEAERKMKEAIEAEKSGDENAAESALISAEIADSASRNATIEQDTQKVKGVTVTKDWEITGIDLDKVPTSIMGTIIRPVDEAAIKRLIKATKGTIEIEGITYKEKVTTSFRRGA